MIVCTCGHKVSEVDHAYVTSIKSKDEYGAEVVACVVLCEDCYVYEDMQGNVLDTALTYSSSL